jgi:hypothetical protein
VQASTEEKLSAPRLGDRGAESEPREGGSCGAQSSFERSEKNRAETLERTLLLPLLGMTADRRI